MADFQLLGTVTTLAYLFGEGVVGSMVAEAAPTATSMVVVVTYWLSFEYVREPRKALDPESAAAAMGRGGYHALAVTFGRDRRTPNEPSPRALCAPLFRRL